MEFHNFIKEIEGQNYQITATQNSLLKFIDETQHSIIYKKRQEGVSTAISLYLLWLLITKNDYSILMVYTSTVDREIFRQNINMSLSKLEDIFEKHYKQEIRFTPKEHNINRTRFPNNSSIEYASANNRNTGRGFHVDLLYISEINENCFDLMPALIPCLMPTQRGKIIITSTDYREIKTNYFLNTPNVEEYWCNGFFDGKRVVIFEKTENY